MALQHPEQTRELYIHGLQIKTFPAAIFELKELRKLVLTSNQLNAIPESINRLVYLEELILDDNQLTALPECLKDLKSLKTLHLNCNRFTIFPRVLSSCSSLESLELASNGLTRIPKDIYQLGKLRHLNFEQNKLEDLPDELCQLVNLKYLNCRDNAIKKIPKKIGNCTNLQSLIAAQNLLTRLPRSIALLAQLHSLNVNKNKFKAFPDTILECSNLEKLSLSRCNLKTIPEGINQLKLLSHLDLSFNKLTVLPDKISTLRLLRVLTLGSNKIKKLPTQISQLTSLRELELSKNPLEFLPVDLYELTQLESLAISGNWNLKGHETIGETEAPLLSAKYLFEKYKANAKDFQVQAIANFLNKLIYFKNLKSLKISTRYLTAKQIKTLLQFIKNCRLQLLSKDLRLPFFKLLVASSDAKYLSKTTLLKALSFKNLRIRTKALEILQDQHLLVNEAQALQVDSHIAFLGKHLINTKSIKTRLKKTGLKVADTYVPECTHIFFGDFPKVSGIEETADFVILQAHHIMAYLNKVEHRFSTDAENEQSFRNLSSLLLSRQPESVELGLSLLKNFKLNALLYTDLLIAFKESKRGKHKRNIRKILTVHLDPSSNQLVRELDWKKLKAKEYTRTYLTQILAKSRFDSGRLWDYFQQKTS